MTLDIGPRLTGSAGEHRAAEYIAKQFRSLGLKTRLQKHPAITFSSRKCVFEVREGGKWRAVQCQPIMLSSSTPPRGVEGEIYFAESGEDEDDSEKGLGRYAGILRVQRIDSGSSPR